MTPEEAQGNVPEAELVTGLRGCCVCGTWFLTTNDPWTPWGSGATFSEALEDYRRRLERGVA